MNDSHKANLARQEEEPIDFMALFSALLQQRWLILASVVAAWCIGFIYANTSTPIYRADTLIHIERKSSGLPGLEQLSSVYGGPAIAGAEIEVFRSRSGLSRTVEDLRLDIVAKPRYLPYIGQPLARRFRATADQPVASAPFGFSEYAWGGEQIEVGGFAVEGPYSGRALTLVAGEAGSYSLMAGNKLVLEAKVGELAIDDSAQVRILISKLVARPNTEFVLLKRKNMAVTKSLQGRIRIYEKGSRTGLLVATLDAPDPRWAVRVLDHVAEQYVLQNVRSKSSEAEKSIEFLQSQLPVVKLELERAEDHLNAYRLDSRSVDLSIETGSLLGQVVGIDNEISMLNLKRAELDQQFKAEHPVFATLEQQLSQLKIKKSSLEARVDELPDTQQKMMGLLRTVQVKTGIYTQLLNKAQELEVLRAGMVGNVRVIDRAVSNGPIKPRKSRIMMLSLFTGVVIGVLLALARTLLRRNVESAEQIENLGLPVYASVPFSNDQAGVEKTHDILAVNKPEDLAVEALRGLRTSIHFALVGASSRTVMVTGPSPNVGKTFVSSNLAALIAQGGEKVLIIDADMRRGTLHNYFDVPVEGGLSDLLAGQCTLAEATRNANEHLHFITRGKAPPNPAELLMSDRFTQLLDELQGQYSMVIVDTPPVLAVTDAAVVGSQVAATLLVARFGQNPPGEIEHAKTRLEQNGVAVKGAVLNGIKRNVGAYGYGYAYYQYEYSSEKK